MQPDCTCSTPSAAISCSDSSVSRTVLSGSGTSQGSSPRSDTPAPSWVGSGASSTRSVLIDADTCATATASSARRTASAAVRTTPAAKPQVPSWTTRTDRPRSSPSVSDSRRASRRLIVCVRMRSTRMSACSQPRSTARVSAASVSADSGSARKDSSTVRPGIPPVYQPGPSVQEGPQPGYPAVQDENDVQPAAHRLLTVGAEPPGPHAEVADLAHRTGRREGGVPDPLPQGGDGGAERLPADDGRVRIGEDDVDGEDLLDHRRPPVVVGLVEDAQDHAFQQFGSGAHGVRVGGGRSG